VPRGNQNPRCPNCGRHMALTMAPEDEDGRHTFQCVSCDLTFLTKDHEPITRRGQKKRA
jgi:tRNA(Ile2) C34 agmatinyltransferase TiaS